MHAVSSRNRKVPALRVVAHAAAQRARPCVVVVRPGAQVVAGPGSTGETVVVDDVVDDVADGDDVVEVGAEGAVGTVVVAARGLDVVDVSGMGTRTAGTSCVGWAGSGSGRTARYTTNVRTKAAVRPSVEVRGRRLIARMVRRRRPPGVG